MSSGFVSGGTIDNPTERDEAWQQAQSELEAARARKEAETQQQDGKSLYEVLQANKAAKQEAFEEANRLKNQFRALDDDEAEFLDSVLEQTRKKEEEVKKDTLEQLEVFRRQKEEAERKALVEANAPSEHVEDAQWAVTGRKRKKGSEKDGGLLKGVKLRKGSSSADKADEAKKAVGSDAPGKITKQDHKEGSTDGLVKETVSGNITKDPNAVAKAAASPTRATMATSPTSKPATNLALNLGYGSSDDDD